MVSPYRGVKGGPATGWLLSLCLFTSACERDAGEPRSPGGLVSSDKERVAKPRTTPSDVESVVAGNVDFGAALYRELREPGKNLFFSPHSVSQAMAMVYAGARGGSEAELARGFHFLPQDRFHPAVNALNQALSVPPRDTGAATPARFLGVNSVWGQAGFSFEPAFLDVLAQHYGSGMHVVDFASSASQVRQDINAWVASRTQEHIKDLLPPDAVSAATRLILVNALHFEGAWSTPFSPLGTRAAAFHTLEGGTASVQLMRGGGGQYMKGSGFEALALDYVGRDFRMLLLVPEAGRFDALEARLSADLLAEVRGALSPRDMDVNLPRFQLETTASLIPKLKALGIEQVFDGRSDLSGVTRSESLVISSIEHKAFVSVDEKGTVAAAATAVVAGPPSVPEPFLVDRPFLFLIEHVETGSVLFLGRYVKP